MFFNPISLDLIIHLYIVIILFKDITYLMIQVVNLELSPFMIFLNKVLSQTTVQSHCFVNLLICPSFITDPSSRN